ncbi:MAG: isoprenylcysteine carboxylmethyltransferase family protein [Calditrichaeota bacterium]|nr:MAG: isoprenylcysteine carboxylmethyltransferase family protein [Calditrichota bacterium]
MKSNIMLPLVSFIWIASEVALIIYKRSESNDADHDSRSIIWLNVIIYGSVALAVLTAFTGVGFIHAGKLSLAWIGLSLIISGLAIRWAAILSLRRYFTVNVAIRKGHQLYGKGLYGTIRHPSYLGSLVSFLGLGVALSNWISLSILLLFITTAFIRRIKLEEQVLIQTFGKEYEDYCRSTWRLIPWLY